MENMSFKKEMPIIIGLAGKAGSGKTSVAEHLVPKGSVDTFQYGYKWDHIFYALPLYELASIKRSIRGMNEKNRQLYAIHDVLFNIYGGSSIGIIPDYDSLVSRVHQIYDLEIEPEGVKPRTFLQKAGDICRQGFEDCFSMWGIFKSMNIYNSYYKSLEEDEEEAPFIVLISDVRFENEAKRILSQPNGIVVCFDASEDTLNERIFKRDGRMMSSDQQSHRSEQEIDMIKSIATCIINTDNMTIEEQAKATMAAVGLLKEQNA
jgi:deoxyadenosine/deoxycytidine kinase